VKRSSDRQSTTNTPSARIFEISGSKLVGLAASTAITLPVSTVVLHRQSLGLALLAGVVPALPLLLFAVVLLAIYAVASCLTILVMTIRIACVRDDPAACLDSLFVWVTNPPIAFLTGTQLKLPKRGTKASAPSNTPQSLPAGPPSDARKQSTPFFDLLKDEMPSLFEVRGRHARPETPESQPLPEEDEGEGRMAA
jgi:hypothetical protein